MKAAVFVEPDGILYLNNLEPGGKAPLLAQELRLNPAARSELRLLKQAGFAVVATSNQPLVSQGHISRNELDRMNQRLRREFDLDEVVICPHASSDDCPCRKPKPGLLTEAAFSLHLELERSFVISNKWQDAEAARLVGCTSVLLHSPWIGRVHRDLVLPDLKSAVRKILQLQPRHALVA